MSNIVSARDRVHSKFCQDDLCILEYAEPGNRCRDLDFYLDRMEEQALHKAAVRVLAPSYDLAIQHGTAVVQGLVLAVKEIDPYERRPDGHLVRKEDGTPVPRFPGDGLD